MALSKIQAESMNLADTYAFTGTVSGAGEDNDVKLISSGAIGATTTITFNTSNFSNTYFSHQMILELRMPSGSYNGGEVRLEFSTDNLSSYVTGICNFSYYRHFSGWPSNQTGTAHTRGGNYIEIGHDGLINTEGQYILDWTGLNRGIYKNVTYRVSKPNHDTSPQAWNGTHGIGGINTTSSSNNSMKIYHSGGASLQGDYRIYGRL